MDQTTRLQLQEENVANGIGAARSEVFLVLPMHPFMPLA